MVYFFQLELPKMSSKWLNKSSIVEKGVIELIHRQDSRYCKTFSPTLFSA